MANQGDIHELKSRLALAERRVAELQAANEAMRESEAKYRALFESIEEGFTIAEVVTGEDGRVDDLIYREANEAYDRHAGYHVYPGLRMRQIAPEIEEEWIAYYSRVYSTGESETKEGFAADLGRFYRCQCSRIGQAESKLLGFVFEDVTERKVAELALRESEERQRLMLELVPALLWSAEPQGNIILSSEPWKSYTGQNDDEISHYGWLQAIHPDEMEATRAAFEHAFATGEPLERRHRIRRADGEYRWHQVRHVPVRDEDGIITRWFGAAIDVEDLQAAQERQAFLLTLGDAMRSESSASEKIKVAARLLGQHMKASRILYAEYDWKRGIANIFNGWFADGAESFPTEMPLEDYDGQVLQELRCGQTVRVDNISLLVGEPGFAAIAAVGVQALLSPPLMIGGVLAMNLSVHQDTPRHWTDEEVALVKEVAERLWADVVRARAEGAQRESEERFRQFANASAAGLWIRDAKTFEMEFVSPAVAKIYGVEGEALLGDVKRWAALVVPDDRRVAVQHLEEARDGKNVAHEFRIRRSSDQTFRWIRNTDFPLRDGDRIPRIGGITEDVTEAKLAVEHQAILLAELQHRVRKIMAMTRAVTQRTARNAQNVSDYAALMSGRLMSLARTQALLTRAANVSVDLESLIQTELAAQAHDESQYSLLGPKVEISPKAAEVLSLAIHELTTNALKYGAFSVEEGRIDVEWHVSMEQGVPVLRLRWTETRPAIANWEPPKRRGFGSELVERRVPYELDGEGRVALTPEGARVSIVFPLQPGASILETGAPVRKNVFGGSIDMGGEQILAGHRILVVEDDYLLAYDTETSLESAGATVVGPFAKETQAFAAIRENHLTAALTDINLGQGASFEIAKLLREAHIPFAFLTGYDQSVVPEEFADVPRFVKPVDTRQMVRELSKLLQPHTT